MDLSIALLLAGIFINYFKNSLMEMGKNKEMDDIPMQYEKVNKKN